MSDFPIRIIEILRSCPNGLTTRDIAVRLDTTAGNVSSRLSKLAAYGVIDKVRGTMALHGTKGAVYRAPSAQKRTRVQTGP
jgi:transcriptional regulator